jgi:hypothetical protein
MTEPMPCLTEVQLNLLKIVRDSVPLYGELNDEVRFIADGLVELGLIICARDGDLIITGKGEEAIVGAEGQSNNQQGHAP